jgi:hypothetical protein
MNDRLPYDVLYEIFDYYAKEESEDYPLETLLLVCRSWNEAALNHRLLWTWLDIPLHHICTVKLWLTRLPRRLERAGERVPLEISLGRHEEQRRYRDKPFICRVCKEYNPGNPYYEKPDFYIHAKRLLTMLTGTDGELCKRWKSLTLRSINRGDFLCHLSYPTPMLTMLRYEQISTLTAGIGKPILPSLPSLHTLHVVECKHLLLPKLDSIREFVVDLGSLLHPWSRSFPDFHTAMKLERLEIIVPQSTRPALVYHFPDVFPNLEFLSFEGIEMPTNMTTFKAPNLQCLSLILDGPSICRLIVNSSLPLSTLRELRLTWTRSNAPSTWNLFLASMEDLLVRCTGLKHITGNQNALAIIIRLLGRKKGEMDIYVEKMTGKAIVYRSSDTNMQFMLDRPDNEEMLVDLVYSLGLVPPETDREIVLTWLDE